MNDLSSYDWKKHATAVAKKDDIEKAFADQAFSFVAQKASKICTRPYLLGFEMIYANDDKSRLVGIFGFNINGALYYAPVFFLNGQIKGQILFWRVQNKKFVPLEEEWIDFILEKNTPEGGHAITKNRTDSLQTGVSLDPMIYPRRYKTASAHKLSGFIGNENLSNAQWLESFIQDFCPKVASFAPTGLLRQFVNEDGGEMAFEAIAGAVKNSYAFAEALMHTVDNIEDLMQFPVKKASDNRNYSLSIRTGNIKAASTSQELAEFIKFGYIFDDRRHDEEINQIYQDTEHNLENMQTPGFYGVMKKDGEMTKVFMADVDDECNCGQYAGDIPVAFRDRTTSASSAKAFIFPEDKNSVCYHTLQVGDEGWYGSCLPDEGDAIQGMMTKDPQVGKTYLLFLPKDKVVSRKGFRIKAKNNKESTGVMSLETTCVDTWGESTYSTCELIMNENAKVSAWHMGILGNDTAFIEVKTEKVPRIENNELRLAMAPALMKPKEMVDALINSGLRKFTLEGTDDGIEIQTGNKLRRFMSDDNDAGTTKAAAFLAADLGIRASEVNTLLENLVSHKKISFYVEPKNVKMALGLTRVIDRADFTPSYDSYFNTSVDIPKEYALRTETKGPQIREIPLNEVYDPSHGNGGNRNSLSAEELLSNDPDKLKELANSKNLPFVFEHGLVGSLVKTFDAAALVDKYLPHLENALDSVGRMIFLFYWKPKDFENAIGQDDMSDMESELTSNFKSLGALTLNLLKKSKSTTGTSALQ